MQLLYLMQFFILLPLDNPVQRRALASLFARDRDIPRVLPVSEYPTIRVPV